MGLEAVYQALPAPSPLLSRLREEAPLGEWISSAFHWIQRGAARRLAPGVPDPAERALWTLVEELLQAHPRLTDQHCDLDREWDRLHYLLSAGRRDEPPTAEDVLADAAIRGGAPIAEHARATQGVPVRYSDPELVGRISRLLDALSFDDLRRHDVPEKMEAAGVYKFPAERAGDAEWTRLRARFEALRAFYRTAAAHGDGVLVKLD